MAIQDLDIRPPQIENQTTGGNFDVNCNYDAGFVTANAAFTLKTLSNAKAGQTIKRHIDFDGETFAVDGAVFFLAGSGTADTTAGVRNLLVIDVYPDDATKASYSIAQIA